MQTRGRRADVHAQAAAAGDDEIKNVAFLDAKGQPIEGSRTGSGYMNDAAEMGFSVKTAAKTLTIEFEAWQGLRTIKVPFKVKAGLGLD